MEVNKNMWRATEEFGLNPPCPGPGLAPGVSDDDDGKDKGRDKLKGGSCNVDVGLDFIVGG